MQFPALSPFLGACLVLHPLRELQKVQRHLCFGEVGFTPAEEEVDTIVAKVFIVRTSVASISVISIIAEGIIAGDKTTTSTLDIIFIIAQGVVTVDKASPQAKWVFSVLLSSCPDVQIRFLVLFHPTPSPDRSVFSWSCQGQGDE